MTLSEEKKRRQTDQKILSEPEMLSLCSKTRRLLTGGPGIPVTQCISTVWVDSLVEDRMSHSSSGLFLGCERRRGSSQARRR